MAVCRDPVRPASTDDVALMPAYAERQLVE
jgi:hypothetical protein